MDRSYAEFVQIIRSDMDKHLKFFDIGPNVKRYQKKRMNAQFWNEKLDELFHDARKAEKRFLKSKGAINEKMELKMIFRQKRKLFDKAFRQEERKHIKKQHEELHHMRTNDPKEFWRRINELGPKKTKDDIPLETIDQDGNTITDPDEVLGHWKHDYEKLFHDDTNEDFDEDFLNEVKTRNELTLNDESVCNDGNDKLNDPITRTEVLDAIRKCKMRKAAGADCIPNEILKSGRITDQLVKLFQECFRNSTCRQYGTKS